MSRQTEIKHCPDCGQVLRVPGWVGGLTMVCPSCGYKLPSFFKLGAAPIPESEKRPARRTAAPGRLNLVL